MLPLPPPSPVVASGPGRRGGRKGRRPEAGEPCRCPSGVHPSPDRTVYPIPPVGERTRMPRKGPVIGGVAHLNPPILPVPPRPGRRGGRAPARPPSSHLSLSFPARKKGRRQSREGRGNVPSLIVCSLHITPRNITRKERRSRGRCCRSPSHQAAAAVAIGRTEGRARLFPSRRSARVHHPHAGGRLKGKRRKPARARGRRRGASASLLSPGPSLSPAAKAAEKEEGREAWGRRLSLL